jgi:DNA repair protein RadA/Sms
VGDSLLLASQTHVDAITSELHAQEFLSLVIIDSIQTMYTPDLSGMAGSVGQVRESAGRLISAAKQLHLPLLLVGHVTKEGAIAGPRVLEHMVDTVLWFEGDRYGQLRLLRAIKNRFGPTDEVGVFQMTDSGLTQVANPSEFFLDQHSGSKKDQPSGSAVAVIMEGLRPLLVEVQALVVPSQLAIPRRIGKGIDISRLNVIVAVLIKRLGLRLGKQDVYVNIAGGLKLKEPAADLAIAASIFSAYKGTPIKPSIAFSGEVGLLGEVRPVPQSTKRQKEASRLGFKKLHTSGSLRTLIHQALRFNLK